ncbi:RNA 2'-phosphotransferase, Tpt1 / KptA family protein [Cryptosporidium muris RN66]|uniref:2'-phosphotransferase n=1 Tax=Cryptosporidium muris (strain RN66) TaxID=441375 RepID=B6ADY2_CRYMR|nr:RNA 2'-phosphotransferase, Tpt1 / KptA family protein [Cryptosporidium muris RN66]EEA06423.1 RNA 2'-phosphotransferase, Tpt1 / KptA family protein [Cryptosporidium muris RN66]|eukprot:XP_002140772.1 RNA 2'-phosphotransferase, Tpt1 / KptA family protein [Cryptosporidium muris RN66]
MSNRGPWISRRLSWLLRHGDPKITNLIFRPDGYVDIKDILRFIKGLELEDILQIVKDDCKQRYSVCKIGDILYIRANQGHSLNFIQDDLLLSPILISQLKSFQDRIIVHGTYIKNWELIFNSGLKRIGNRQHIHFIPLSKLEIEPSRPDFEIKMTNNEYTNIDLLVSYLKGYKCTKVCGIRPACEVLIFIDIYSILNESKDIKFFCSSNNLVLTRGDSEGILDPNFFILTIDLLNGFVLHNKLNKSCLEWPLITFLSKFLLGNGNINNIG